MGYIDLHVHSKYSDGKHDVEEILEMAHLNNVSVIIKAPVSLQISDSRGKVLVSGSYKAGDRVSATGIPPLKVAVTDTSSVTVNYMGGTIAVPATKQATFTLPNR